MNEIVAKLLISIGSVIATGLLTMILGKAGLFDKLSKKRKEEKKKADEAKENELVNKVREVVKEEVKPIKEDTKELKEHQELNTASLVVMTRSHMKHDLDDFEKKGFATVSEKASWKEMLDIYRRNGGNHFREYVDQWEKIVMALPAKAPKSRKSKGKKN